MGLQHLLNEKAMKTLFGPTSGVGDTKVYLAEMPFVTVQGEGPNIGKNTLFVRFFGCNLANSCGVDWCDTGHSFYTTKEITKTDNGVEYAPKPDRLTFDSVEQMYTAIFENNDLANYNNVVFTGGEPMLWQITIAQLISIIRNRFSRKLTFEIETNGTTAIENDLVDWFKSIHITISPKVHVAKNFPLIAQLNGGRSSKESGYENIDHQDWCLKFVYEGKKSQALITTCMEKYSIEPSRVYLMPEGTTRKKQLDTMTACAEYCINNGYNFSARMHVLLWDVARGV